MDFIEAREKRREILGILKQQQAEDAACVNDIKAVAIEGKTALLRALTEWLTSIKPGQPITTSTRNAFNVLDIGLTAEDWQNTQANYDDAEARLKSAVAEEAKADAAYYEEAPLGFASAVFADDARKRRIAPLKACRDAAKRARETAQAAMVAPRQLLADRCERILRTTSLPERLDQMCGDPQIARYLLPIIQQTAASAGNLWITHSRKHVLTSAKMDAAVRELLSYYNGTSGTSMAVLSKEGGRQ